MEADAARAPKPQRFWKGFATPQGAWRCVVAHLVFVVGWDYPRLAYTALMGRALKMAATLCGALCFTPLYKRLVDPTFKRVNRLYDYISPFNRRSFIRLRRLPYTLDSVVSVIGHERRGAVLLEFAFVLLQVALFAVPAALLPITVVGVLINTVPRQFYAQLKLMVRALHIISLDNTIETLVELPSPERKAAARYGARRPYSADGAREVPSQYLAFAGKHSGCWEVVVTKLLDHAFTFVGGMLILYLLAFSLMIALHLLGAVERDEYEGRFPLLWVTLARFAKSACNFVTTENLMRHAAARQGQHELYFLQRCTVLRGVYALPRDLEDDVARRLGRCPRQLLAHVGRPRLDGQRPPAEGGRFASGATPVLSVFDFLTDPDIGAAKYQAVLDDGIRLCGRPRDLLNRDAEGRYPTPFHTDAELNEVRAYAAAVLWHIFDVTVHKACPGAGTASHDERDGGAGQGQPAGSEAYSRQTTSGSVIEL